MLQVSKWSFRNLILYTFLMILYMYKALWKWWTDDRACLRACLYYKLTNEFKGSGELIRWIFLKIYSGNLLIIPYQLTKFQAPSSNSFRDILLTSLKCQNFQRAITPKKYGEFFKKYNQVIYSSSPISWSSFKPLAQILFEIACWQV